jgi:hypothetical protein
MTTRVPTGGCTCRNYSLNILLKLRRCPIVVIYASADDKAPPYMYNCNLLGALEMISSLLRYDESLLHVVANQCQGSNIGKDGRQFLVFRCKPKVQLEASESDRWQPSLAILSHRSYECYQPGYSFNSTCCLMMIPSQRVAMWSLSNNSA